MKIMIEYDATYAANSALPLTNPSCNHAIISIASGLHRLLLNVSTVTWKQGNLTKVTLGTNMLMFCVGGSQRYSLH